MSVKRVTFRLMGLDGGDCESDWIRLPT
jgi:hypothetical protein